MNRLFLNTFLHSTFNLIFGLYSHFIKERLYLSESLIALLVGILLGPHALGIIFPETVEMSETKWFWDMILQLARFVMTFQTMAAGISLPKAYLVKKWKSLAILIGPILLCMWLSSSLLIYTIFWSQFSVLESMILAACITPTDPVLASSVVKGKFAEQHIPEHVRDLLSAESGANDGAAMPLLFLPLILIISGPRALLKDWIVSIWIKKILLAIIFGALAGWLAKKLLKYSQFHDLIDKDSFIVFSLALTLAIMALMNLIGCNDMVAVFVAGAIFAWDDWFTDQTKDSQLQSLIDSLFNSTFFIILGAAMPWHQFNQLGWLKLVALAAAILLFRRLPVVWFFGPLGEKKERAFAGWFGPIGVGAIFYSITSQRLLESSKALPEESPSLLMILPLISFIVMSSVLIHGITVPLFHLTMTRQITLDLITVDYWKQESQEAFLDLQ